MHIVRLILFISIYGNLCAQELINNSDFEKYNRCPQNWNIYPPKEIVNGWNNPSKGTPDYFNKCSKGYASVPKNWAGFALPLSGNAYVGLYLWQNDTSDYREYIQTELTRPLKKQKYKIRFGFMLSSYSTYVIDRIGVLLTDSVVSIEDDKVIVTDNPIISIISDSLLSNSIDEWKMFSIEYNANGGERYLTIGNFWTNAGTKAIRIPGRLISNSMLTKHAYYYLDLIEIKENPIDEIEADQLVSRTYVLSDINYSFGKYELLPIAYSLLDSINYCLEENQNLKLLVKGYTDEIGSKGFNLDLSLKRAESVKKYLLKKGINAERIEVFGFGEESILAKEMTEQERAKNRRVELVLFNEPLKK